MGTNSLQALGGFIANYWFWILCVALSNGTVVVAAEWLYRPALQPSGDLWPVRMYLASGLLLFDNLCVLWWYADSTHRQTSASEQQLTLAGKDYIERNKPVVYTDRVEDPDRKGYAIYVARNVGGGYAVNVFYFDVMLITPVALGSLASGEERVLPAAVNDLLQDGGGGRKHLLVAEGPYSRTTQWTPTLNLRTQQAGEHSGQVLHRPASVTYQPPRFKDQSLSDYMTANRKGFHEQLKGLSEDNMAPRLLEAHLPKAGAEQ